MTIPVFFHFDKFSSISVFYLLSARKLMKVEFPFCHRCSAFYMKENFEEFLTILLEIIWGKHETTFIVIWLV